MDEIVRSSPQLNARYLEKMQRVQELVIGRVGTRLAGEKALPSDPRPATIVGGAFACMQAAHRAWFASDKSEPFGSYLDQAMATLHVDKLIKVGASCR